MCAFAFVYTKPFLPTALRSGADVWSHLLHFERKLFLWGPVTDEAAAAITAQLLMLCSEAKEGSKGFNRRSKMESTLPSSNPISRRSPTGELRPVELVINSRGGSLTAGRMWKLHYTAIFIPDTTH